jgi:predicted transcriptional regulator
MGRSEFGHLGQESIQILLEIFNSTMSTGDGVDSIVYRAQHEHQLSLLDELEQRGYLRKDDAGRYFVTLYGLSILEGKNVEELFGHFEKLFSILREHYKVRPKEQLKLIDLASISELTSKEVIECLSYMFEGSFWSSRSNNLLDPDAHVKPSETILRYQTFKDVVLEIRRWRDEQETQLSRKGYASILQRGIEDITAMALKPEGPILSLLFELDSDEIQRIVERAGLVPNWSLTKDQSYSHKTRKRV